MRPGLACGKWEDLLDIDQDFSNKKPPLLGGSGGNYYLLDLV
jgi:hypothetical protein